MKFIIAPKKLKRKVKSALHRKSATKGLQIVLCIVFLNEYLDTIPMFLTPWKLHF